MIFMGEKIYQTTELITGNQELINYYFTGIITGISPIERPKPSYFLGFFRNTDFELASIGFFLDDVFCTDSTFGKHELDKILSIGDWLDKNRDKRITVRGDYDQNQRRIKAGEYFEGTNLSDKSLPTF